MKSTELRIGNLVKVWRFTKHNEPKELIEYPVEQIGKDENLNDYYVVVGGGFAVNVSTGIQPIPLTEEWLLKFGFIEDEEYDEGGFIDRRYLMYNKNGDILFTSLWESEKQYIVNFPKMGLDIEFVHQLQNLYFALTSEELKYTP